MDPNLKNFAVFINSSASLNKTTEKSTVQIPITGNLSVQDATKALQVMISQFRFTNSIYNIDASKNTLKIACEFAPGRGYTPAQPQRLWQTWVVKLPPGTYNVEQLASYLSEPGTIYPESNTGNISQYANRVGYESVSQRFEYAAVPADDPVVGAPAFPARTSFVNCFAGFGAIPIDPNDSIKTNGVVTADNSTRVIFQSPDLGHLIQYGTDIYTPCVNRLANGEAPSNSSLDFSFVYKGIYLIFDTETAPLLKILGYFNIERIPAPAIVGYYNNDGLSELKTGYGIRLEARQVYDSYPQYDEYGQLKPGQTYNSNMRVAADNTTFYTVSALTGIEEGYIEAPDFPQLVPFSGYFYGTVIPSTTVQMYVAYELDAQNKLIRLEPGMFISGAGVFVPSPYITNFVETKGITAKTPPSAPLDYLLISQAAWDTGNGFGLTVGSPITLNDNFTAAPSVPQQVYVTGQPTLVGGFYEVPLSADLDDFSFTPNTSYSFMTSYYVLNSPQDVSNTVGTYTNWVASLVSINERTARLVPNMLTNLEGAGEIHIHCAQLRTRYLSSTNFQALAPSDVICVVPVDVPFGSAQSFQPPVTLVAYLTNVNISVLDIQLTNAAGVLLDFNGLDWSMVLKCEEVDILNEVDQNVNGTFNTVYQDQLRQMESTAPQQVRMMRHQSKRRLPYQFFENNERSQKLGKSLA